MTNVGAGATTGAVTVNDVLPTGLTYVAATGAGFTCSASGQSVTCTSPGPIAAGQSIGITLTVAVGSAAAPGVTNTATVATPGDGNPANNTGSVTSVVASGVDLAISKGASALITGSTATFTLGVSNVGSGSTTGTISVTDNLATGLMFVSGSGGGFSCSATGQLVSCSRAAALAPGQSASITITVAVSATAGASIVNTATLSTPGDNHLPNNSATVGPITVGTPAPDLAITKAVNGTILAGGTASFTIGVQNVGPGSTTGPISITDILQSGLTFVSSSGTGWSCQASGPVVTCSNPGPLAPGNATTLQLVVAVAPGVTSVENTASVSTTGDSNSGNNSAGTGGIPTVPAPDLSLTKVATAPFTVGQPASYALTVTNAGSGPTIGSITVTDNLPAPLRFVSASGAGWSCSATGQLVTCTNSGPLAPGASSSITLTVLPTVAAAPSVTNEATVTTPGDANGGNNAGIDTTPVGGTVDLALDKSGPDSVSVGGIATYALAVRNIGTLPTSATITLADTLPPGVTFQSASGGGFSCSASGAVVTCTRTTPPLPPGDTATVTLNVLVTSAASAPLRNRACIATTQDANAANNCDTVSTAISGGVDLVMLKDVVGALVIGQPGRYVLGVRNVGIAPAAPIITVVDTLPPGLGFLSATGNDWMCAAVGNVVTCLRSTPLAPGGTSTIDLSVSVNAQAVPGVNNCARVSAPNETGSTVNNTSCVGAPVAGGGALELEKRASRLEAQVGDVVDYTVTVKNTGAGDVTDAVVSDTLPVGFSYEARTARLGRASIAEPAGAPGPVLLFTLGRIARGSSLTLTYRLRIGAGARIGVNTNVAVASSAGGGTTSSPGHASTRIVGGFFQERGAIVGKIYMQCNCASELQEGGEVGIPGVRVFLADGSSVVTDVEGKYSFYNVASRLHVVKIDRATLPQGAVLTPLGNRNAGDGYSRFADVKMGELHKADFAEGSGSAEVLARVLERRRGGEVSAAGERAVPSNHPESEPPVVAPSVPRDTLRGEARAAYDLANDRGTRGTTMLASTPLHPKGPNGGQSQAYSPLIGNRTLTDRNSQLPVTPLNARDRRTTTPTAAGRLEVTVEPNGIPADGQTLVPVYVRILDVAGERVKVRSRATLESSLGRWLDASALETSNQGLQVTLGDGYGAFYLVAPGDPGRGELRVTTDFGEVTLPLTFVASARQLTATGLLNARVDLRALVSGGNALASDADGFEEALRDWSTEHNDGEVRAGARGALFLKGRVAGDRLLTLAYDSERDRGRTYFRDIRPDEFYPTYGDGALREFDAQSRRRFYARLDNGTSYTMFGDFQTTRADERRVLSAYDRTLNGAVQHFDGARGRATLFASQGRARQVVDELPGRGISGPYSLTRAEGLVNSERVEIITRDRNQPSVILSRDGAHALCRLHHRSAHRSPDLPQPDAQRRRQPQPGVDSGDVRGRVGGWREVLGVWRRRVVAPDESTRGGRHLRPRREPAAAHAARRHQRDGEAGGRAPSSWASGQGRASATSRQRRPARAPASVGACRRTCLRRAQRRRLRQHVVDLLRRAHRIRRALLGTARQRHAPGGRSAPHRGRRARCLAQRDAACPRATAECAWRAEFGYRYARESGVVTPGQSTPRAGRPRRERDPRAPRRGRCRNRRAPPCSPSTSRTCAMPSHRGALGGEYILSNRARLYGRHEWLTGVEGAYATNLGTTQQYTVFGIDADYLSNTHMFSEYRARDAYNGRDAEASIGLRNRWALGPGLIVNTSFERVSPLHVRAYPSDALAVTGGIEWTRPSLWKSTARLEFRNADTGDNMLASFGYARKLTRDWTFLGRTLWDVADLREQPDTAAGRSSGFAWRETDRNRWNAVMRYENKVEHLGARRRDAVDRVGGAHPRRAGQRAADGPPHALRVATPPSRRVTTWGSSPPATPRSCSWGAASSTSTGAWTRGSSARSLPPTGSRHGSTGSGGELGLLVMKNLRVAAGYNLFGFTDKDLNTFGTTRKGAYLELGFKFDESLFGLGGTAPRRATTPAAAARRTDHADDLRSHARRCASLEWPSRSPDARAAVLWRRTDSRRSATASRTKRLRATWRSSPRRNGA